MAKMSQRKVKNDENSNTPSNKNTKRTRKSIPRDSPPQRSSVYRGVTRHRWTGRYEAHLWDKNCWNESQSKKGRQVYLGAYDDEETAARAYDLAALKYWGQDTILNFPLTNYEQELKEMGGQSKEEYIGSLRRKSSGFSRGVSKYRGVARHHHNGRWEARIGRVFGNKYLYLGTYATQEEAATAYDMAAIEYRGLNAVTNFDLSRYVNWPRPKSQHSHENPTTANSTESGSSSNNPELEFGFGSHLLSSNSNDTLAAPPQTGGGAPPTSSALGLLLQSSKFKEMLERSSSGGDQHNNNYPATIETSESKPPRRSFPEDIQTFFDCHDSSSFTETDDIIFGDLSAIAAPIFHGELDA
ncbi:hypothetical protein QN277_024427 [Acacia crassicarpa]|nr:hypothetical protein QN277_024427 [Acacia crassicarpa]